MTAEEKLKTSEEWQKLCDTFVIDPDGWDRRGDFHYSWYEELITEREFNNRMLVSTCAMRGAGWCLNA